MVRIAWAAGDVALTPSRPHAPPSAVAGLNPNPHPNPNPIPNPNPNPKPSPNPNPNPKPSPNPKQADDCVLECVDLLEGGCGYCRGESPAVVVSAPEG